MGNPGYPSSDYPGVPPPAYGAGTQHPQPPPAVMVVQAPMVGPEPTHLTCPHCHASVTTNVEYMSNSRTHLFALLLCIICPFGCCLIPYCTNSCMSATHTCPNCHHSLGTYDR